MSTTALSITVHWGDRLISSQVLRAGERRSFTLGSGARADVPIPRAGRATFSCDADGPRLAFTEGVRGRLVRNGEVELPISEAIHRGLAEESGEGWALALGRRDRLSLEFGALRVDAEPTKAPGRVGLHGDAVDYRWWNVLLVSALLALLMVMHFELSALEGDTLDEDGASAAALTIRHVLVVPPKKEPPRRVATREPAQAGPQSPAKAERPVTRAAGRPALTAQTVGNLFAGVGAQGLVGSGALDVTLTHALKGIATAGNGLTGLTLRGTGGGGFVGGGPVGIGVGRLTGLGGPRDVSLTRGAGQVPDRFEVTPPDIECAAVGCLDKELIRRVVRQHLSQVRYCYEELLPSMPQLEGRVVVKWHVTGQGHVDASEVVSSTAQTPQLGACIAGRIRTWVFPSAKRAEAGFTVSYPFTFKLSGQ